MSFHPSNPCNVPLEQLLCRAAIAWRCQQYCTAWQPFICNPIVVKFQVDMKDDLNIFWTAGAIGCHANAITKE